MNGARYKGQFSVGSTVPCACQVPGSCPPPYQDPLSSLHLTMPIKAASSNLQNSPQGAVPALWEPRVRGTRALGRALGQAGEECTHEPALASDPSEHVLSLN